MTASRRQLKVLFYSSATMLSVLVIVSIVMLLQIYGCAGASLDTATRTGICSDAGLHGLNIAAKLIQVLILVSLLSLIASAFRLKRTKP